MNRIEDLEKLYSSVVGDVLDRMGYRAQGFSSRIGALTPARRVSGRIFTAKAIRVNEEPQEPYKLEMAAIDTMSEGDVLVVDADHNLEASFWGELLSTACMAKGVRGIIMSTCTRDLWALEKMEFPVFGIGITPVDSLGRMDVVSIGEPIEIDGVKMKNGDLILGDHDGVVAIPEEVADEAIAKALEKVSGENVVREALAAGMPVAEVFKKYGIL